jgi:hypothetical protein
VHPYNKRSWWDRNDNMATLSGLETKALPKFRSREVKFVLILICLCSSLKYVQLQYPVQQLTTSMLGNSFWQANSRLARQEISPILQNAKVQCRVHIKQPLDPILSNINHSTPSQHIFRSVLILPSHLRIGLPSGLFPSLQRVVHAAHRILLI